MGRRAAASGELGETRRVLRTLLRLVERMNEDAVDTKVFNDAMNEARRVLGMRRKAYPT